LLRFEFSATVGRKLAFMLESVIPPDDPYAHKGKAHTSINSGSQSKRRDGALRREALNGEFIWVNFAER